MKSQASKADVVGVIGYTGMGRSGYGNNPYTVSWPSEPTNTFPFTTRGTANFVAKSRMSRDPAWLLL